MSTRAFIAKEVNEGLIEGIYCHFDGYPEGVGKILLDYYDHKKTKQLLKLGNISVLESELYPKDSGHSFETPESGVVIAYGRDRKEPEQESVYLSKDVDIKEVCPYADIDWFYLQKKNGNWFVKHCLWSNWKPLIEVLVEE